MLKHVAVAIIVLGAFIWSAAAQPVYILVDDSGSMDERRKQISAQEALSAELEALSPNSLVSVNLFGGNNGGECSSDVQISAPAPLAEFDRSTFVPAPSGFTPLAAAIGETVSLIGNEPATIVVIGDAEDTCGVDLCAVVPSLLNRSPGVDLRFVLSEPNEANLDRLGCVINARVSEIYTRNLRAKFNPIDRGSEFWWALLGVVIAVVFLGVGVPTTSLNAFGRRQEEIRRGQLKDKDGNKLSVLRSKDWRRIIVFGVLSLVIFVGLSVSNLEAHFSAWAQLWNLANTPFGSMFFPTAIAGYVGWGLLLVWKQWEARHGGELKTKLDELKTEMERAKSDAISEKKQELLDLIEGREEEQHSDDLLLIEGGGAALDPTQAKQLDEVATRVDAVRKAVTFLVSQLTAMRYLRRAANASVSDHRTVTNILYGQDLLTSQQRDDVRSLFSEWRAFLQVLGTERQKQIGDKILSFDAHALAYLSIESPE